MSLDLLKEDLKNNKIRNMYLLYGQEEYLKKYYLDAIEKKILQGEFNCMNKIVIDGKVEIKNLTEACETMPVFSDKKIILVKNSGLFKPQKKVGGNESKKGAKNEDIALYVSNIPEYTCLIFWESEIDKRLKIIDKIKGNGLVVEFNYQKPGDLVNWVMKAFRSYKKDITSEHASQLVGNCEQGMSEIANEIKKLVEYVGQRTCVEAEDIEKVCTKSIKSRIFDLTDAISDQKGTLAIKLLDDMVTLKEPIPKILFMITKQIRQMLEMKLFLKEGYTAKEAASKMGMLPFLADKVVRQAGKFDVSQLKKALQLSLELDIAIKTGKIEDRIAAEILILSFLKK